MKKFKYEENSIRLSINWVGIDDGYEKVLFVLLSQVKWESWEKNRFGEEFAASS
jgi:hypothetical protein